MIAVIYFYFRLPADVKFFSYIIFTAENDRPSKLVSIAQIIGINGALPSIAIHANQKTRFSDKTGFWRSSISALSAIG